MFNQLTHLGTKTLKYLAGGAKQASKTTATAVSKRGLAAKKPMVLATSRKTIASSAKADATQTTTTQAQAVPITEKVTVSATKEQQEQAAQEVARKERLTDVPTKEQHDQSHHTSEKLASAVKLENNTNLNDSSVMASFDQLNLAVFFYFEDKWNTFIAKNNVDLEPDCATHWFFTGYPLMNLLEPEPIASNNNSNSNEQGQAQQVNSSN